MVGESRDAAESQATAQRLTYIQLLLDHGKQKEAQQAWDALPSLRRLQPWVERPIELKLAAADGTLAQVLEHYQSDRLNQMLRNEYLATAEYLRVHNRMNESRTIREFVYQNELDAENLEAANFLGLAGVYLETGQTDRAVRVLRRMNLVSGEQYETFVPAATLLAEHGRTAEAIPFLRDRLKAAPWDNDARLQLARLLSGDGRRSVAVGLMQTATRFIRLVPQLRG